MNQIFFVDVNLIKKIIFCKTIIFQIKHFHFVSSGKIRKKHLLDHKVRTNSIYLTWQIKGNKLEKF